MRTRILGASLLVVSLVAPAAAQTKISGTLQCSKPDQQYSIEVGDRPNHLFGINQVKCTWTKPLGIAGLQSKEDAYTTFNEITANTSRDHGSGLSTMENGDKSFVRFRGSAKYKDGKPDTAEGSWSYAGGTGKLKGLKGKGTYKGTAATDGSATYEVEGEYELPK